ncbi:MAG TPA: glucose 1-dehydrogenase [Anaerolineales bacterium]|nr:glucose 1-dehydrogenase [Anaerolineales bacterium]
MKLNGKVAIVTGGGSGMGRETAILFAKEGAKVVIGDWNEKTLKETVNTIRSTGGEVTGLKGNVAVQSDAEALVDAAVKAYGRMDILVNNAGVMDLNQGAGEVDNSTWERVMGVNVNGPLYLTRRAVPVMVKSGGGAIVNIASVAGMSGAAAGVAYTTSKHALIGMTRNTAWRYLKDGIRCNAIAAGAVETNIVASIDPTKMDSKGTERAQVYYSLIPAQLKPIDIANLVLFLASDEARYINGTVVPADGGWLAA